MAAVQQQNMNQGGGMPFNPNPRTLTWQRLESMRLKRLGLSNKYSRHFNVLRSSTGDNQEVQLELAGSSARTLSEAQAVASSSSGSAGKFGVPDQSPTAKCNSVAPFATVGKATCGFFFTDQTNNKKMKFGIPPSDLVKWRNFTPSNNN